MTSEGCHARLSTQFLRAATLTKPIQGLILSKLTNLTTGNYILDDDLIGLFRLPKKPNHLLLILIIRPRTFHSRPCLDQALFVEFVIIIIIILSCNIIIM